MKQINLKRKAVTTFRIFKKALFHFGSNDPIGMAGTTAYFAIFSIAPILIIIISVFGYFTGDMSIREKLFEELQVLIGQESTQLLQKAIDNYDISEKSGPGAFVGVVFFLVSATTLFTIMQNSINYIWRVKVKSNLKFSLFKLAKDRLFSFGVILSLGFVLLISLILDASIAFLKDFLKAYFAPGFLILARAVNIVLTLGIISVVFASIYRFLPDVRVRWSASWFGAIFASVLFAASKIIIGLFIGTSNLGAVYGAAGSFIVILLWIYFVSIIFYFGVELTHQYSIHHHHSNKPLNFAVPFQITKIK